MPIYEYACPSCGHEFEQIVRLSAPAPACPECGGDEVDKKISLAAFHLKGGGWYSDAYAGSDNKGPADKMAKVPSSSTSSAASSSTDSSSSSSSSSPAKPASDSKASKSTSTSGSDGG